MIGKRTQHMIEKLAHQDNFFPGTHRSQQLLHGFTAQLWFQHILEVFFAEQVQAILADAAQQRQGLGRTVGFGELGGRLPLEARFER